MTSFSNLFAAITHADSVWHTQIPQNWQQGRTTYGGLTAALCVEAALRSVAGLPPLRSAQFAFVGPAAGAVRMTSTVLRQGKSTVFIAADLFGAHGLATHATLCFGAERASALSYLHVPMPAVPAPELCPPLSGHTAPDFALQFDYRQAGGAGPTSGAATPALLNWLRHRDENAGLGATSVIALADALPPAAMTMFTQPAPISTMTWSMDIFSTAQASASPWCLIESRADTVGHGYSSQDMTVWNEAGELLMLSRQNVAVFI